MARTFSSSTDVLSVSSAVVTAYPFSFACWAYYTTTTAAQNPTWIVVRDSGFTNYFSLYLQQSSKKVGCWVQAGASGNGALTTTTATVSTWFHAAAVFTSATSRAAFLNGGGKGTNATSLSPTGMTVTDLRSTGNTENVAEAYAAIWNVALSDSDVANLASAVGPRKVKPQNLIRYCPIHGSASPEPDLVSSTAWTLTGTAFVAPPRIYSP